MTDDTQQLKFSDIEEAARWFAHQTLSFAVEYSEPEGLWYGIASGAGKGEYFEAKRCGRALVAAHRVAEKVTEWLAERGLTPTEPT